MVGRTVGNYRIIEKLGEGGMGSVYRAVDQMVQRNVAIKVLRPDLASNLEVSERFHSEAVALAKLNHPAIATLYSFFREGAEGFIVMEYVPGRNLEQILRTSAALEWQHAAGILLHALGGMSHAHAQGIIHRDLKPANIMITPEGGVKLTDFGIARMFYTPRLTRDARVVGTPEYLAPERILGKEADARSDVYSLGIVFYEMITGRLPFESTSDFALMRAHIETRPKTLAEAGVSIPAPIEHCLMTAIQKEPAARYQDAAQFAQELREAIAASGCAIGELSGVFNVGAKETVVLQSPTETTFAAPPKETVFAGPPKETVVAPVIRETVFVPPAKETVVSPIVGPAAIPPPQQHNRMKPALMVAGGLLLVLLIAVLAILLYRSGAQSHQPASAVVVPETPRSPLTSSPASTPSPEITPAPAITPPRPDKKPRRDGGERPSPDEKYPAPTPDDTKQPEPEPRRSLTEVRTLYLRPVHEDFDSALREQIEHELGGRLELVRNAGRADGVLSVVIEDSRGNRISGTAGRVVGLKGSKKAIATMTDVSGRHQLWSAVVDDKHNLVTAMRDDMKRLASRLAKRLRSDMR